MSDISNTDRYPTSGILELSAILNQVQQGDSLAEAAMHQQFVERLMRVATQRISDRYRAKIDAEDVVQSVFVSFFRRHRNNEFQFNDWNDLWALLLRITTNKCSGRIEKLRTQKRDIRREIVDGQSTRQPETMLYSTDPSVEEVAIFRETLDQLFDRLEVLQQQIVCLRLQGMSNLEISQAIQRTERTVYRMLNQIKQLFREMETGEGSVT